jgi:hypothetical protein
MANHNFGLWKCNSLILDPKSMYQNCNYVQIQNWSKRKYIATNVHTQCMHYQVNPRTGAKSNSKQKECCVSLDISKWRMNRPPTEIDSRTNNPMRQITSNRNDHFESNKLKPQRARIRGIRMITNHSKATKSLEQSEHGNA